MHTPSPGRGRAHSVKCPFARAVCVCQVPDVRYVIDFCLVKEIYCDPSTKLEGLRMQWASKASCLQRSGRAGRVQEGHCFRLCPQRFWDMDLAPQVTPEIQRTSLDHLILQVKVLKVGDPRRILQLAMQPPSIVTIEDSLNTLKLAGASVFPASTQAARRRGTD